MSPTSSTPFAASADRQGGLRSTARALAATLDELNRPALLDPEDLASLLKLDVFDVTRVLEAFATEGLLEEGHYARCPRCTTPIPLADFRHRAASGEPVECTADSDHLIPPERDPTTLFRPAASVMEAIAERMSAIECKTAIVLCALDLERDAVIAALGADDWVEREGDRFAVARLESDTTRWEISIGVTGALMQSAASAASAAVATQSPNLAVYLGIAGARKDLRLGDVLVADQVADVSGGKDKDGAVVRRPDAYKATHVVVQTARQVRSQRRWNDSLKTPDGRRPEAFIGAIASSNRVVADEEGETAQATGASYDQALAYEMESAGFMSALHRTPATENLVVRGISDGVHDKEPGHDAIWQPEAARNASAFLLEFLRVR